VARVPAKIGVAKTRGEIMDDPKRPWLLTSMGNPQVDLERAFLLRSKRPLLSKSMLICLFKGLKEGLKL